jgi:hypothetical protein
MGTVPPTAVGALSRRAGRRISGEISGLAFFPRLLFAFTRNLERIYDSPKTSAAWAETMTDEVEDLTIEMFRPLHTKLDDIQAEMRLRFTGVQTGLAALDQHLSAFHAVDAARADEIADLRRRLERVERRLELADPV